MADSTFFMFSDQENDVIVHGETLLKVKVIYLNETKFRPSHEEVHVFGDVPGNPVVFETVGWSYEYLDLITDAARWFARYSQVPEMGISESDPRKLFKKQKRKVTG